MHSVLLLVMIVLILTGRRSGTHLHARRTRREQAGLRAALVAELDAVLLAYAFDQELLDEGATRLIAARIFFSTYRSNMNRLVGLSPAEVAAVTTAHAAGDMLDAAMEVLSPARRQRQVVVLPNRCVLDVPLLLRAAMQAAVRARDIVQAAAAAAEIRRTMRDRVRGLMPMRASSDGATSAAPGLFGWRKPGRSTATAS